MDYYDFIEYLAKRSWFEKMLFRMPITFTMELFVASTLDVAGFYAALFESLTKQGSGS